MIKVKVYTENETWLTLFETTPYQNNDIVNIYGYGLFKYKAPWWRRFCKTKATLTRIPQDEFI